MWPFQIDLITHLPWYRQLVFIPVTGSTKPATRIGSYCNPDLSVCIQIQALKSGLSLKNVASRNIPSLVIEANSTSHISFGSTQTERASSRGFSLTGLLMVVNFSSSAETVLSECSSNPPPTLPTYLSSPALVWARCRAPKLASRSPFPRV